MKAIKHLFIGLLFAGSLTSCYDLLDETPKDFLTPENSYTDKKDLSRHLPIYIRISVIISMLIRIVGKTMI